MSLSLYAIQLGFIFYFARLTTRGIQGALRTAATSMRRALLPTPLRAMTEPMPGPLAQAH